MQGVASAAGRIAFAPHSPPSRGPRPGGPSDIAMVQNIVQRAPVLMTPKPNSVPRVQVGGVLSGGFFRR
jgi:hypothetical protein